MGLHEVEWFGQKCELKYMQVPAKASKNWSSVSSQPFTSWLNYQNKQKIKFDPNDKPVQIMKLFKIVGGNWQNQQNNCYR